MIYFYIFVLGWAFLLFFFAFSFCVLPASSLSVSFQVWSTIPFWYMYDLFSSLEPDLHTQPISNPLLRPRFTNELKRHLNVVPCPKNGCPIQPQRSNFVAAAARVAIPIEPSPWARGPEQQATVGQIEVVAPLPPLPPLPPPATVPWAPSVVPCLLPPRTGTIDHRSPFSPFSPFFPLSPSPPPLVPFVGYPRVRFHRPVLVAPPFPHWCVSFLFQSGKVEPHRQSPQHLPPPSTRPR
jgi:hypothetical protein